MDYPLEQRCLELLKLILYANGPVRIGAITEQLDVSRRSAYYDLEKIDDWLSAHSLPKLLRDRAKGISVTSGQAYRIQQLLFHDKENPLRVFTPMEREKLITCAIILSSRPVFTEDFMEWCMVSRNTTVNDLKSLGSHLKKNRLTLRYVVKEGYRIQGDPICSRALFCLYYPQLMPYFTESVFSEEQRAFIDECHLRLKSWSPLCKRNTSAEFCPRLPRCFPPSRISGTTKHLPAQGNADAPNEFLSPLLTKKKSPAPVSICWSVSSSPNWKRMSGFTFPFTCWVPIFKSSRCFWRMTRRLPTLP